MKEHGEHPGHPYLQGSHGCLLMRGLTALKVPHFELTIDSRDPQGNGRCEAVGLWRLFDPHPCRVWQGANPLL
jgi:hypothetical protein